MDLTFVEALEPAGAESARDWRAGDAWLAGGTWLFSEPQPAVRRLLDLRAFEWPALSVLETGLRIAATCTIAELARFTPPSHWSAGPLLRGSCELLLGSFKIWNEATVGGNICLALPAGPMTSLAASLDGVCEIWRAGGSRELVPAAEFVTANRSTLLRSGDLCSQIAVRHASRTHLGRSAAVVIGRQEPEDGGCVITITAATTRPRQLRFPGIPSAEELRAALATAELPYFEDAQGTVAWRAHLTRHLSEQVRTGLALERI
jgi:CO/xanthine dehydrogenase FAD-binding subunit